MRNVAPRSPSPPVNTTLLSRNHSLRETKSQFIWKTRLTHLSSALITERRVGWCLAEGPPSDARPVARGAGRGRSRGGPVPLCRPFLIGAPAGPRTVRAALPRNSGSVCCTPLTPLTLRPLTRVEMNRCATWRWSARAEIGLAAVSGACFQNAGVLSHRLGPERGFTFFCFPRSLSRKVTSRRDVPEADLLCLSHREA